MAGRRHPQREIAAKLRQADLMEDEGKTQREITHALGVSIMTYHRWRKMRDRGVDTNRTVKPLQLAAVNPLPSAAMKDVSGTHLEELQVENGRLRRLVTDLLLEKMRLEDELRQRAGAALFSGPDIITKS